MRKITSKFTGAVVAAGLAVGVVGVAGPASAVPIGGDTMTTFTIEGGTLSVSAPFTADLGTFMPGHPVLSGQLGPVTVVDDRAAADATWTAFVSTTGFSTGGATFGETIEPYDVMYDSGFPIETTGSGNFAPGVNQQLMMGMPAFTHFGGTGRNSATWMPMITVLLPPGPGGRHVHGHHHALGRLIETTGTRRAAAVLVS